jgi:hypothetical protein
VADAWTVPKPVPSPPNMPYSLTRSR